MLCKLLFTHFSVMSSVILMLRTYAFSGRKRWVLAVLSIMFFGLFGVTVWVMSRELVCLYRGPRLSRCIPDTQWNCSVSIILFGQPHRLFRPFRSTVCDCRSKRDHCSRGAFWLSLRSAFTTLARLSDYTDINLLCLDDLCTISPVVCYHLG